MNTKYDECIEQVIDMFNQGMTKKEIAENVGVGASSISRWLIKVGVESKTKVLKEYKIKCKSCKNDVIVRRANAKFCSDKCRYTYNKKHRGHKRICENCNKTFFSYSPNVYCSDECREEVVSIMKQRRLEKEEQEKRLKEITKLRNVLVNISNKTKVCNHCGKEFIKKYGIKYCSDECKEEAYKAVRRNYKRKHRVNRDKRWSKNGKVDYSITLEKLHSRDNGICHLCNRKTNYNDFKITEEGHFIAGDDYPSIDHVIPIANGGLHRWNNVKLAHRKCNYIKGDNDIEFQMFLNI